MDLEFFKFFSWTALWAWVLSDTAARYGVPLIDKFHGIVDRIFKTNSDGEKVNYYFTKTIAKLIEIIFSICLTYIMTSWSVWCVLRCVLYTQGKDTNTWLFFISGGICCELALGKVARAASPRNFFSMLPYTMAMGAFIYFPLNYAPIISTFPWLIKYVGLNLY